MLHIKFKKTGPAVLEKTFKDYAILYMYIAQGQGLITLVHNFDCNLKGLILWSYIVSYSH